jgi:hypothetical protein
MTETTETTKSTSLVVVAKEPGVADLPLRQRGFFAKAIILERQGDHKTAEEYLNKAVAAEGA